MKRVTRISPIKGKMARSFDFEVRDLVPPLPSPHWFARGPRGGVYLAEGPIWFQFTLEYDFTRDLAAVIQWSERARYIRPGSRLHAEALEQLAVAR